NNRALLVEKKSHVMAATTAMNKCRVDWNKKITAARARAEAAAARTTAAKATTEDAAKQEDIDDWSSTKSLLSLTPYCRHHHHRPR
ncbi:hypothetical protein ISN45_Aa01g036870, partial [Arabidopsis thaliana x Arabidopsis arenosa]